MSKYKTMIRNDIEECNKLIESKFAARDDVQVFIGKYTIDYPNFKDGIINYISGGSKTNEISNIKIIKGKLEYLLNHIDNPELYKKENSDQTINVNTSVSNNIAINMSIEEIKKNVDENTCLGDAEKQELLEKLKEIKKLQESKETKSKKWQIAKNILSFILDKGADIAIMYIPQILKCIQ